MNADSLCSWQLKIELGAEQAREVLEQAAAAATEAMGARDAAERRAARAMEDVALLTERAAQAEARAAQVCRYL